MEEKSWCRLSRMRGSLGWAEGVKTVKTVKTLNSKVEGLVRRRRLKVMKEKSEVGFKTFENLQVYQVAREFRKAMYKVSHRLPDFEKFKLASQIRAAAVSVTNNIAEGHGRYHYLDQLRFLLSARGSTQELLDDLNVCADEVYLQCAEIEEMKRFGWRVHALIIGYGRYLRSQKTGHELALKEEPLTYADESDPFADLVL